MSFRSFYFPLILILSLFSCKNDIEPSERIVDREKFIEILSDVQIFESMNQFIRNKNPEFKIEFAYQWIYEEYDVSEEDFRTSLLYYTRNAEQFEEMYDEVIVRISEKQIEHTKKSDP